MEQDRALVTSVGNSIETVQDTTETLKATVDGMGNMSISDSDSPVLKSSSKENFAPLDRSNPCRSSYSQGLPRKPSQRSPGFMQPTASWKGKETKERKQEGGLRSKPKWVSSFVNKKGSNRAISQLNETQSVDEALPLVDCDVPRYMRPTKTRMSKLRRSETFAKSKLSTTWRTTTPDHHEPFSEVTNAHQHGL